MKQIIDKLVNSMTMYRLTLYALSIMAGAAISFSFVGILQFNSLSMILSLAVLLVASIVVNKLFGYMFAVRTNNESAYITALILFLIFPASDTLPMAVSLGLVATIAMASKYLVAWRGRHLFNPAAFAAFLSGIIGFQTASWWVATGSLLPFTFILGGLVLYKTKRLQMGLIYVVTSILIIAIITTLKGNSFVALLPILLTSWPLLFFSGFMLSEPLGLPPRKHQRGIFATGVAVLANAQLQLVGVSIGPQAALLVGNVYAFICGQRGGIRLRFKSRRQLSRDQVEYIFEPLRPLRYKAGQYIELQLPHDKSDNRGIRRMFTIASSPSEDTMKLGVRHYTPSSTYKKALGRLVPGSVLSATATYGDFVLPSDKNEKLLLIAGGIGITPFCSQLAWLADNNDRRDGVLLYSTRSDDDAVYTEVLNDDRHGIQVHTMRSVEQQDISDYCKDIAQRTVYISGPPGMVDSVARSAASLGAKRIITDHFAGY